MTGSSRSATISRHAHRRARGFTLTELAMVLLIVGLLLGSLMYTLSAQVDTRGFADTERRLDEARELLLAFAVVNGRLPCPRSTRTCRPAAPSRRPAASARRPTTASCRPRPLASSKPTAKALRSTAGESGSATPYPGPPRRQIPDSSPAPRC